MRCDCRKCMHNEDGYCSDASYVTIDENGECDLMLIVGEAKEEESHDYEKSGR